MEPVTFKEALCQLYQIEERHYVRFVLRHALFRRVRMIAPFVRVVHPDFLFHEIRLVEKVAQCHSLREVQEEIDFYQHKFVANFVLKEALRFRLSGMRLMSLASNAFKRVPAGTAVKTCSAATP